MSGGHTLIFSKQGFESWVVHPQVTDLRNKRAEDLRHQFGTQKVDS